jgi:hypothetical protein
MDEIMCVHHIGVKEFMEKKYKETEKRLKEFLKEE